MILHHLELQNYRNYAELAVDFKAHKVIFLGNNAQGKTTLLEAINMLATGKSPTATKDADLVRWGTDQAIIRSEVERELTEMRVDMLIRTSGRRAVRVDGIPQKRLADLFGKVLVVLFRSEDLQLVKGSPSERRDYMDTMLVQVSSTYYQQLHDYNRVVTQRNSLLRAIQDGAARADVLDTWSDQLVVLALAVWRKRLALAEILAPMVQSWHERIAVGTGIAREQLTLRYHASVPLSEVPAEWEDTMRRALAELRPKEIARGQTLVGPHRDDIELLINGRPAKVFGSQGQQRTVVLALKLAELDYVREMAGESPILLLDDVLAELDVRRQNALLDSIGDQVQTFVTSTHLNDFSAAWLEQAAIYQVEGGQLTLMKSQRDA
ncbi:MAG TPA: DNA replication/repair protein RecF [Oscillatoriaceae cyanobacterium]